MLFFFCFCFKKKELYEDRKARRAKEPPAKEPSEYLKQRINNYAKSGSYYPQGMKRVRPEYTHDTTQEKKDFTNCQKEFPYFNKKMGNLEILRCLEHQIALGFHIAKTEGLNDVFGPLFEFWQTAPTVFVADFNCNAAVYCQNREPDFWEFCLFLIDSMHAMDHTRCSHAFHAATFKRANAEHSRMNDSGALFFFVLFFLVCLFCFFLFFFAKKTQSYKPTPTFDFF